MANGRIIYCSVYGPEPSRFVPERTVPAAWPSKNRGNKKLGATTKKSEQKLALKKAAKKAKAVAKFKRFLKGGRILRARPPP